MASGKTGMLPGAAVVGTAPLAAADRPMPEPDRVCAACRHAPLKLCADHLMGAGHGGRSQVDHTSARLIISMRLICPSAKLVVQDDADGGS